MKRRLLAALPFAPAALVMAGLFVLVALSREAWRGSQRPVPAAPSPIPTPELAPWDGNALSERFEYVGVPRQRVSLPLKEQFPTEPWCCKFMRAERKLWQDLGAEKPDPAVSTLRMLVDSMRKSGDWNIGLGPEFREDRATRTPGPDESLADVLRRASDSAGLYVIPLEEKRSCLLTRNPRETDWPRTWQLVRVLKALRGEVPDFTERAWLRLECPVRTLPAGDISVREIADWLEEQTGLRVEYSDEAKLLLGSAPAMRIHTPDEEDTIESCARVALVRAGLDVAARNGAVLICKRGEAEALAAGRFVSRELSPWERNEGLRRLSEHDSKKVFLEGAQYRLGMVIVHIANACNLRAAIDDVTWDDPTLIALPGGSYTVRELREQLWTSAGVRTYVLKGSLWFVEPVAE